MAVPTIPPTEPHFFKPLLPGFHHKLLIPISFFKYLNGQKRKKAILRSRLGERTVKVNGRRLEDGWTDFAKSHDLHVGDFLVFRHEGDMVFDVSSFTPSGCDKEYMETMLDISCDVDSWKVQECSESDSIKEYLSGSEKIFNDPFMARPKAEASPFTLGNHPSFVSTLKRYSLESSMLFIPVKFAKQNGLINRSCRMILRSQQRSWQVTLQSKKFDATQVYIRLDGWHDFWIANGLKEGDNFKIELIKNGQVPIMDFHGLKGTFRDKARSTLVSSTGPYFVATFRKHSSKWSKLYIPKKFATSNGLIKKSCKIVIIDPKGIHWLMSLYQRKLCSGGVFIQGCWTQFAMSNDLKEGDTFKLQLVKGLWKTLTMNFYVG